VKVGFAVVNGEKAMMNDLPEALGKNLFSARWAAGL
jgi:hypothetical protein